MGGTRRNSWSLAMSQLSAWRRTNFGEFRSLSIVDPALLTKYAGISRAKQRSASVWERASSMENCSPVESVMRSSRLERLRLHVDLGEVAQVVAGAHRLRRGDRPVKQPLQEEIDLVEPGHGAQVRRCGEARV